MKKVIPFAILLTAWLALGGRVSPLFLPSIGDVAGVAAQMVASGLLTQSLWISFLRISIATLLSVAVSVPLALVTISVGWVEDFVKPLTDFMRFIPVTAFYPLLIMWIGIGETMKIVFIFMATFFYFFPTVILAFRSVPSELKETALTSGISKTGLMRKVYLPAALPGICESFLMMYGIGWTYIIVAENINTTYGLGHIMQIGSARGRTDMVFAAMFVIILVSVLIDTVGRAIIRRGFKWYYRTAE